MSDNSVEAFLAKKTVPRWHGYIGGKPGDDLTGTVCFTMPDGNQPNWFHRQMQYLILGIYWRVEAQFQLVERPAPEQEAGDGDEDREGNHDHRHFGIRHRDIP